MKVFRLKLRNKKDNVIFNSIAGGYSHIMWIRTENPDDPVVKVFSTPDLEKEARGILEMLKGEVDFEFLETEEGK